MASGSFPPPLFTDRIVWGQLPSPAVPGNDTNRWCGGGADRDCRGAAGKRPGPPIMGRKFSIDGGNSAPIRWSGRGGDGSILGKYRRTQTLRRFRSNVANFPEIANASALSSAVCRSRASSLANNQPITRRPLVTNTIDAGGRGVADVIVAGAGQRYRKPIMAPKTSIDGGVGGS